MYLSLQMTFEAVMKAEMARGVISGKASLEALENEAVNVRTDGVWFD
jgi:hypothetical protein